MTDNKKMDFCGELCEYAEDIINRQKAENKRLEQQLETLCIALKLAKTEAYNEFWNSRPERLNEQCEGREEYNKGWNACLDEFWEIRNNLVVVKNNA